MFSVTEKGMLGLARRAALFGAMALLAATPAHALSNRVHVSAKSGVDNATCGAPATPCRTFQRAHDNATAGGQVSVMDPGDYGPVQIIKSISIVNDGAGTAGVLSLPGPGAAIAINAGATDKVILRGLAIETQSGVSAGVQRGIEVDRVGALTIAKCAIRGFINNGYGVYFATTANANFSITDTVVSKTYIGIRIFPQAAVFTTGVIERVTSSDNNFGIEIIGPSGGVGGGTTVTVAKSVVTNNSVWGVIVQDSVASIRDVVSSNNGGSGNPYGAGFISTSGLLRLAHSTASGNQSGVIVNGGVVESYGDNDLRGNAVNAVNIISGNFDLVVNQ